MKQPSPARIITTSILVASTLLAVCAVSTQAAPSKKQFTVGLSITDADGGTADSTSLMAGTDYTFVFTLTNKSHGPQYFGSAEIVVPSGYDATPQTATSVQDFTASPVSGGVLVTSTTGAGIAPGQDVAVTVDVTTPSSSCDAEWTTFVKQSNDFLGTGNDFMISGQQPTTTVGTPYLSWSAQQPGPTEFNQDMSPAPIVTAFDPCGHVDTQFTDSVTLSDKADNGTSPPADTVVDSQTKAAPSVAAVAGIATFSHLQFTTYGFYDRLTATATGFTAATSNWFIVAQQLTTCATADSCGLNLGDKQTTAATVTTGAGSPGQYVSGSRLGGTSGTDAFADCTDQEGGSVQVSDTMIVDTPRAKEVTLTISKTLVNAVSNNGTPFMDICLDIPTQAQPTSSMFLTKADVADGITVAHSYQGLLPDCADVANTPPCVVSRNKRVANEIIVFDLPAGDPHFGAY